MTLAEKSPIMWLLSILPGGGLRLFWRGTPERITILPQAQSLDQECELQLGLSILMSWAPFLTGASVISWPSGDQLLVWFVA